jgi:hypothetical protein
MFDVYHSWQLVIPSKVEEFLTLNEKSRDVSTFLDMTI